MTRKLCECGCGRPAPIATKTKPVAGHVKGEPMRFRMGHGNRGRRLPLETRQRMSVAQRTRPKEVNEKISATRLQLPLDPNPSYNGVHQWIRKKYPKTGVCEECGQSKRTQYAFLRHPSTHTRNRDDYRELCAGCHLAFDIASGIRPSWKAGNNPQGRRRKALLVELKNRHTELLDAAGACDDRERAACCRARAQGLAEAIALVEEIG